jgi:hypothetical protein
MKIFHVPGNFLVSAAVLAGAVPERADAYIYPVAYNDYYGGYYTGWGWYPIIGGYWPWTYYGYAAYPPYGYSYYGDFFYQPRYATYGAIAFSPETFRYGLAWGEYSQSGAVYAALSYCGSDDCQPVVWVRGGCAAIARGTESNHVSWGYHSSRYGARSYAVRACKAAGGEGCRVLAWLCSW